MTHPRLHIVTGKGGTGKTAVAAALALALAAENHKTLLVEVEGRQGIAQLFDTPPLPYIERKVAVGPDGGEVYALAIDVEAALLEYLDMFYRLGRAGRALQKFGAFDFVTTIAPGLRDIILTGKIKESTTRTERNRRVYDAVIVDAPPTGRIGRFLNVTAEAAKLAKVGPIKNQSEGVAAILRSPMTRVHVVTLLEEMPVQECRDAIVELSGLGMTIGSVIVNAARPSALSGVRLTQAALKRGLAVAGLPANRATVTGLLEEMKLHQVRLGLENDLRAELTDLSQPIVELPMLPNGMDLSNLYKLANILRATMPEMPGEKRESVP